jgi:arylamine N-acetyltransferase
VEFNRNQFFFLGVVILLLGLQVRVVSAYVLTPDATRFLAERTHSSSSSEGAVVSYASDVGALPNKVFHPPEWLGWCLISVGAVLMLHSLAMPKP